VTLLVPAVMNVSAGGIDKHSHKDDDQPVSDVHYNTQKA